MPALLKNPGPTAFSFEFTPRSPAGLPSRWIVVPQLLPPMSGTSAPTALRTPGMAARPVSARSKMDLLCAGVYPFHCGVMLKPITWSVRIPRLTFSRFTRLFRKRPVGIRSTIEMVSCAHTSTLRSRAEPREEDDLPVSSLSVAARVTREASQAG